MKIKEYLKPSSLEEAYSLCCDKALIIGGGAFLNLGDRAIEKAIDLSGLGLNYIKEKDDYIEIGAMTTLRELETNRLMKECFSGVLSETAASIMGVQVRNISTVGGSVAGRFGFSDIITTLLALNARVELYKAGNMDLNAYLHGNFEEDILLKVMIKKNVGKATFACLRKTSTDFSVLNAAAAVVDGQLRISIGARPGIAKLAKGAMGYLEAMAEASEAGRLLAVLASEELQFGSDIRGSGEYRKELCKTLVKRCVMEVLS